MTSDKFVRDKINHFIAFQELEHFAGTRLSKTELSR